MSISNITKIYTFLVIFIHLSVFLLTIIRFYCLMSRCLPPKTKYNNCFSPKKNHDYIKMCLLVFCAIIFVMLYISLKKTSFEPNFTNSWKIIVQSIICEQNVQYKISVAPTSVEYVTFYQPNWYRWTWSVSDVYMIISPSPTICKNNKPANCISDV